MFAWELNLHVIVMRIISAIIAFPVQGFAIAAVAVALGDKGPRYDGRLTLNPAVHAHLPGFLALLLTGYGWSKPVEVADGNLRPARAGFLFLALVGSAVMFVLAFVAAQLMTPAMLMLPHTAGVTVAGFLRAATRVYVAMGLVALLPVPAVAGQFLLQAVGLKVSERIAVISAWALMAVTAIGVTRWLFSPIYLDVVRVFLGAQSL